MSFSSVQHGLEPVSARPLNEVDDVQQHPTAASAPEGLLHLWAEMGGQGCQGLTYVLGWWYCV